MASASFITAAKPCWREGGEGWERRGGREGGREGGRGGEEGGGGREEGEGREGGDILFSNVNAGSVKIATPIVACHINIHYQICSRL